MLSRNALVYCYNGDVVQMILNSGAVVRGPDKDHNLVSLMAFQYGLTGGQASHAWSVYRDSNWTAQSSSFNLNFNQKEFDAVGVA